MSDAIAAALRSYAIDADAIFKAFSADIAMHRDTMRELVERYDIRNKSVLSVGPGDCAQEYYFHTNGNSLFLVDIDESGSLEPTLVKLAAQRKSEDAVTYVIGDARRVGDWLKAKFDVIFTSGFTPDEAHRADTLAQFTETARSNGLLNEIGVWPPDVGPFSRLCEEIIEEGLADGGLYIMLSYASGPDIVRARNYLPALEEQLQRLGLRLVEAHCLAQTPGVHLIVAQKDKTGTAALARREALGHRPPLRSMHARTTFDLTPIRLVPAPSMLGAARTGTGPLPAEALARLEATIGAALDRYAPTARRAYYAGTQLEMEGLYLMQRGLALEEGWYDQTHAPAEGVRLNLIHPALLRAETEAKPHRCDLCLLSFVGRDEKARELAARADGDPVFHLFGPDTLSDVRRLLSPSGVLLYQGRTGGIDPLSDSTYPNRMGRALKAGGFDLIEMFVVRSAPGFFFIAARPEPAALADDRPFRIIPGLELDNAAVQLWPKPDGPSLREARGRAKTSASLLAPELNAKLDSTLGKMIERLVPSARTALYAGKHADSEARYLIEQGLEVAVLAASDAALPLSDAPAGPFDLCLVSLLPQDDAVRAASAGQGELFAAGTLEALLERLKPLGLLIYQGRTGGVDANKNRLFVERLKSALDARGLRLLELYSMQQEPGLFTLVAARAVHPVPDVASEIRIFAAAEVDNTAVRLWPPLALSAESSRKLDQTVGTLLTRYRPTARTALYAGAYAATEGQYLTGRGLGVTIGSHERLDVSAYPAGTFDLCFLSFLAGDEAVRSAAVARAAARRGELSDRPLSRTLDQAMSLVAGNSEPLFLAGTLESVKALLVPNGLLIYQGRTGGANPLQDKGYARRLRTQLGESGLQLIELYVVREEPGLFMFTACSSVQPGPGAQAVNRIFAEAQIDNTAIRIWPRSAAATARAETSRSARTEGPSA